MKNGNCSVETFWIKDKLAMFDFGHFAVVVKYNHTCKRNEITAYFDEHAYFDQTYGDFLKDWGYAITKSNSKYPLPEISLENFKAVERLFLNHRETLDAKLYACLKKHFPEEIKLYGH